jgi:hypothetical protein
MDDGDVILVILGGVHDLGEEKKTLNSTTVYQRIEPEAW